MKRATVLAFEFNHKGLRFRIFSFPRRIEGALIRT